MRDKLSLETLQRGTRQLTDRRSYLLTLNFELVEGNYKENEMIARRCELLLLRDNDKKPLKS